MNYRGTRFWPIPIWKTLEWKTSPVFLPIFAKCPPFFGQKPVQTTMHRQRGSLLYSSGERVEDNSMLFVLRGEASSAFNSTAMYRAKEIENISGLHTMSYLYEVARQVHFRSTMLRNIMCSYIFIYYIIIYLYNVCRFKVIYLFNAIAPSETWVSSYEPLPFFSSPPVATGNHGHRSPTYRGRQGATPKAASWISCWN